MKWNINGIIDIKTDDFYFNRLHSIKYTTNFIDFKFYFFCFCLIALCDMLNHNKAQNVSKVLSQL